ncbi:general amino-acid permease GAP1 [Sclerotinia borealis F-4128]|uniref:General amino-acid permease GAP1 n=1 Tax=Sclerotinia borealis (strain F-4128) TaxID=1432307 RepID=W9CW42_SCLBF|nr:general amino-acid permease GAP1 [Sclerotinia borealis F-4128]
MIGLLVPYNSLSLLSTVNASSNKASPFILAIQSAGITGLHFVMNAVILIAVLSIANTCVFGSSRLLASLAAQGQAPHPLAYIDRKGRPLVAIGIASAFGLLAYLYVSSAEMRRLLGCWLSRDYRRFLLGALSVTLISDFVKLELNRDMVSILSFINLQWGTIGSWVSS